MARNFGALLAPRFFSGEVSGWAPKKDRITFVSSSHCQFKVIGISRWTPRLRPRRQDLWLICFFGKIAPFEQAARSKGEIYGFPARLAQREMEGHGTTDGRL